MDIKWHRWRYMDMIQGYWSVQRATAKSFYWSHSQLPKLFQLRNLEFSTISPDRGTIYLILLVLMVVIHHTRCSLCSVAQLDGRCSKGPGKEKTWKDTYVIYFVCKLVFIGIASSENLLRNKSKSTGMFSVKFDPPPKAQRETLRSNLAIFLVRSRQRHAHHDRLHVRKPAPWPAKPHLSVPRVGHLGSFWNWARWDTMGHHGTPWDTMGHHGTPWDTMGYHGLVRWVRWIVYSPAMAATAVWWQVLLKICLKSAEKRLLCWLYCACCEDCFAWICWI